jgi:hypothetical protein
LLERGESVFRRTDYDDEAAAAKMRSLGGWVEPVACRLERGSD